LSNNYRLTPGNPTQTWLLRGTKRAIYPVELWYDYNNFAPNATLPVPTELIQKEYTTKTVGNQMPKLFTIPGIDVTESDQIDTLNHFEYGPGFLSAVYYNNNSSGDPFHDPEFGDGGCGKYLKSVEGDIRAIGPTGSQVLDCMHVVDVWREINGTNATPTVGRKGINQQWYQDDDGDGINDDKYINEQKDTSFEQTIGIY